jgi:hypothetical protein
MAAVFYVLGFSLTPDELGHNAAKMNLQELYHAKDTVLYYEELSDSSFAKWLPAERIVESRIDSLIKASSAANAPVAEGTSGVKESAEGIFGEKESGVATGGIIRDFGLYAALGYAAGGDYLTIMKANSGLSSLSGVPGFIEFEIGAQFKTFNHFYLSPRIIFENSSVHAALNDSVGGAPTSGGTSETRNALILPGMAARYYLMENSRNGLYIGGSAGLNAFLSGFGNLDAVASNPQLGIFAGWQMNLFSRLFHWKEGNVAGIEAGYNYIPVTVANQTPTHENFGGAFITFSSNFYSTNFK